MFFSSECLEKHGAPSSWRPTELVHMGMSPLGAEIVEAWEDANGAPFELVALVSTDDGPVSAACSCCDPRMTLEEAAVIPESCQRCGTCCTSHRRLYVDLVDADWERMGDQARAHVDVIDDKRYMRMVLSSASARCSALVVDPSAGTFLCSIYEERPTRCREFTQGRTECTIHLVMKRRLPVFEAGRTLLHAR